MEYVLQQIQSRKQEIAYILMGNFCLIFCSFIWIPTTPVPITLQTFALFILALTLPPRVCLLSTLLYLFEATVGLPVLGTVHPLWFLGPCAGYLFAFPIASFVMSQIAYNRSSMIMQAFALLSGLAIIYGLGFFVLSGFVGAATAFHSGVLFFVHIDLIKIALAITIIRSFKHVG